jgi:GT2 family glycosyltransferase
MPEPEVTVAIPVRNGGQPLAGVLASLAGQTVRHALLICDSGSTDGSLELARAHGASVIEIRPGAFAHGPARNLLMQAARTSHVALLTQDAEPASADWLERLLEGFALAPDVALVYGPYRPRADAPASVRLELERWFASLSATGKPRLERLTQSERAGPAAALVGARGFFTDANACIAREAWLRVPFRELAYAEDRALALDMLRAGYAKAYVPAATVIHSHAYSDWQELRRCFDEWRGLLEVYGWREPAGPRQLARRVRGELGYASRELEREGVSSGRRLATLAALARHNVVRLAGILLGSHADVLPRALRRRLSLEGRGGFAPLELDRQPMPTTDHALPNER